MQIHELLDRFELLYPNNTQLSDLRRAYIDLDLSSIFRLTDASEDLRKAILEENLHSIFRLVDLHDTEELRKAVIEKNLHSIFRLVDYEDLRKLINENNNWKLWPVLEKYVNTQFISAFKNFAVNDIKIDDDCFSRGQLQSKIWLVDELKNLNIELGTVFLCAGWYGTLATMIFESGMSVKKVRSFDIDRSCIQIAEIFNKPWVKDDWKFKSATADIHSIDYENAVYEVYRTDGTSCTLTDSPDTVINTSCEHIENFSEWYDKIPLGVTVILQSNNYFEIPEHVNCSESLDEFSRQIPMNSVLYEGELKLPKYTRFMKIGVK